MTDISGHEYERWIDNAFGKLFWEEIDRYLQDTYKTCGEARKKTMDEVRVYQGMIEAINLIKTKPDTLIKDIRNKLK